MKNFLRIPFWAAVCLISSLGFSQCPTVVETITDESCIGACDGEIQIDISAGTGPYTVQWFDGGGVSLGIIGGVVSTETITGLCAGNYSVDVSSAGTAVSVWTEDFESGMNGWTLNVPTGVNGADNNYFEIDDDEAGMPAGQCGTAGNGNESLHITSVFNPAGGAAYDAGGLCGILFCPEANVRAESPLISTVGFTSLTLTFDFISNGEGLNDNASLWYNDGGGWTLLDPSMKSNMCALQGEWTAYSIALPASCENIANLQIGFNWTNNDDGAGADPSFAVNDIEITSGSGGCTTSENYVVGTGGPCACPITITETITDESCPGDCDGAIVIDIANGTGPYDVEWFDGGGASIGTVNGVLATDSITGLCPGNYSVEVTEAGGGGGGGGPATVWTEGFDSGVNGWTLNVPTGVNGADNNFFEIDDDESGLPAGTCGAAGMGSPSLHVTSVFFPGGGAAYDAGGLCGILFCPETNMRAESPAISTVGFTGLTLNFDFIGNGDGLNDNASLWYNDGSGWTLLDPSLKSNMCALQGEWTAYSVALPASCDNIANLQIGFNWTNNDDGVGSDPSFAVHDIEIVSTTSGGGGGAGCTQTANFTVNPGVDPTITAEASTDITNCTAPDGTVTITANGDNYELFTSAGASVTSNATGSFTGLAAGDYYVEVSLNGCMVTSSTFTIANAAAPAAPNALADATYCVGDPMADLTVSGTGGTFNWYSDPGLTTNIGTGGTLTPGTTQGATTYYVTETVAGCESPASTVTITINVCCDLDVSTVVTDETCDGLDDGSVAFTINGSGTYDVIIDGTTEFNDVMAGAQNWIGQADGTYAVQVVDINDPACDTTFNITINQGATVPITSENVTDITDCVNPDGTFTVTATGATSYELYTAAGGLVATNATGSFTGLNAGNYYVIATDGTCTGQSSTLTINNAAAPPAPVAGTDATYCDGDAIADLTATAGSGGTLTWYDDAGLTNVVGGGTTYSPNNTVGTTIYYVTETVAGCESPATAITITINPIPAAPTAGTDATYCLGDALADMTATAGSGGTLNWYDDAGLMNNIGTGTTQAPNNTVGATTYYVTESLGACVSTASTVTITINDAPTITSEVATDLTDCVTPNGTITITSNGTSYELFDSGNNSIATNATGAFTGLGAGDYYVVVSDGTCTTTGATITISDQTQSSSSTQNVQACEGSTYTFADGSQQTITGNTSYVSTLTNAVGCDSLVTENVTAVQVSTTIIDTTICEGTDYTSQGDAANFVNVLADFQHTSTLTGASGCDSIIIENITVTPTPTIELGIGFTACLGETITLTATTNGVTPIWSTGQTAMSIDITMNSDTLIYATVSDQCGSATDSVMITTLPAPVIDAGVDQVIPLGGTVDLEVTSASSPISYTWSPSTGLSCTNCPDPTAGPTGDITYIVSGIDENGCVGYDTVSITIDGEISFYVPNIFSPNGDGENDIFRVYGPQWDHYKMEIYNRWGGLVFLSEDPNVEWDGTHYKNGEECPQAVFVYKFWGVSTVGMTFERAGNVMLTR